MERGSDHQNDGRPRSPEALFNELCESSGCAFDQPEDFHLKGVDRGEGGEANYSGSFHLYSAFLNSLRDAAEQWSLLRFLEQRHAQVLERAADEILATNEPPTAEWLATQPAWIQATDALDFARSGQMIQFMVKLLESNADTYEQAEAWDMAIQRFKGAVLSGRVEIHPSNAKFVEEAEDSRDDCLRRASIESMRREDLPQEKDFTGSHVSGVVLSKLWKAMGEAGFGVSAKAFAELTNRTPGVINSHHPRSLVKENKTYRALLVALIAMAPTEDRDWLEENISGIERR